MADPNTPDPSAGGEPNFDQIAASLQTDPSVVLPSKNQPPEQPFFDAGDALAAIPRGVADAARGVYGLADAVTFDALPDWRTNPFGQSDSTTGQLLQGLTNFAAGFVPVTGVLGKVGKIGSVLDLTTEAELAAEAAGLAGKARLIHAARGVAAGAITDFAVWDGHQERLSNLIESVPGLQNPVTEFLAAKQTDSQIVGRLKGALEGLGMGAFTESMILGLKAMKAARGVQAAGGTAEEMAAAAEKAAPQEEIQAAYRRGLAEEPAPEPAPEPSAQPAQPGEAAAPSGATAEAPASPKAPEVPEGLPGPGDHLTMLRNLGLDDEKIKAFNEAYQARDQVSQDAINTLGIAPEGRNPRNLTATERLAVSLKPEWMNLEHFDSPSGVLELLRTGEQLFLGPMMEDIRNLQPRAVAEMADAAIKEVADISGAVSEHAYRGAILTDISDTLNAFPKMSAKALGHKFILRAVAEKHYDLMKQIAKVASGDAPGNLERMLVEERSSLQFMLAVQAGVKGMKAEASRMLGQFRSPIGGLNVPEFLVKLGDTPEEIAAKLNSMGGREAAIKQLGRELAAWGDGGIEGIAGLHKMARASIGNRFMAMTTEYWINSVLSGLKTGVVNFLGPVLNSVYKPIETATGASVLKGALLLRGDAEAAAKQSQVVKQAIQQLVWLTTSAPEAWESVKKIGLGENGIFAPRSTYLDESSRRAAITAMNAGLDPNSTAGLAVDWLGKAVRLPTAFLGSTDEFVKQMNYRSFARARLSEEALGKGIMDATGQAQYVAEQMDKLIYDNQAYSSAQLWRRALAEARASGALSPIEIRAQAMKNVQRVVDSGEFDKLNGLSKQALAYSQDVAFTTPAEPGSISYSVQKLVANHPFLKFVLPFVNTPMNILKFTGQRLDAIGAARGLAATVFPEYAASLEGSKNRFIQDFLSRDPRRIADAYGRLAFGTSIGAYILTKAADGTITGRGPQDPEQRKILLEAGWLPYSVKVGDGYVSYARLDPFATLIGTMADIQDYNKFSHPEDQEQIETLGKGVMVAIANNFTNKSYLTGISNFVQVLQDPSRQMDKFLQRYAGSFVPNIAGQSVLAAGEDENMRDVRGILDAMVAKTPGLSATLEPQRNVLGEPVKRVKALGSDTVGRWVDWFNPIAYREVSDNVIKQEMYQLGHAFTPPKKTVNGVDLTGVQLPSGQSAYDRWSQLHGEVTVGGMTLQDSLKRLIKSREYQKLSPVSENGLDSPRIGEINSKIQEYRAAAYAKLLKEAPTLAAQDQQFRTQKRQLKAGIDNRIIPHAQ